MKIEFCIQDPTYTDTTYLYEAIVEAAKGATAWRGVYAFASQDGVNWLFEDPIIKQILHGDGQVDLLVGLDAITNRQTLERLQALEKLHKHFRPRVFWNEIVSLFHPKISDFTYPGGGRRLIVGSGNLTPGGLMNNIEGYTIISGAQGEAIDVSALDEFFARHTEAIRSIDSQALERAEQNLIRRINHGKRAGNVSFTMPSRRLRPPPLPRTDGMAVLDRILIAQVPRAGARWSQVHFNANVVRDYFRISNYEAQRVYLSQVGKDGARSSVEVRPCVYSPSNKNPKIEFGAATGLGYPKAPPVLVLRERQLRVFDYMLLLPGADGYTESFELTNSLPRVGRGLPRVITDIVTLERAWAECPILTAMSIEAHAI